MADGTQSDSVNPQTGSFLAQVPAELLIRIMATLKTKELGNVRLTCRRIERTLFNSFAHEFFRKKQFMAYTTSVQALVNISQHQALSQYLKHILVSTDNLQTPVYQLINSGFRTDEQLRQCRLAVADNDELWDTGALYNMLVEAFRNLNPQIVDIRDFNSHTRRRDGGSWRSYGARTLEGLTNATLVGRSGAVPSRNSPTALFRVVLAALATAGARPKSIEINTRGHWGIADEGFMVLNRVPSLVPVLESLETLHLVLSPGIGVTQGTQPLGEPFIYNFLASCPNIKWLRLNFDWIVSEGPLLSWLSRQDSIRFDKLERIDLGGVKGNTRPQTLLSIISKHSSTLQTVSLRRVQLPITEEELETRTSPFITFFKSLRAMAVDIREFNLSSLRFVVQAGAGRYDTAVEFTDSAGLPKNDNGVFTGTSTAECVQKIRASMSADWPRQLDDADDGEDDEEDDSDEDDGDGDGDEDDDDGNDDDDDDDDDEDMQDGA
ncbi:hypothetical protein OQA88_10786 [Cercophora sp. LCS_1]